MNAKKQSTEVAPAFSMEDFAQALEQHDYQFQVGQVVSGRVQALDAAGAYVDIGGKSPAFLPIAEASVKAFTNLAEILPLDSDQEFMIIRGQDEDGQMTISRRRLQIRQLWQQLQQLQDDHQSISVRVTGVNKGGVTVNARGLRGFIPRSQLVERDNLEALIGQTLTVSFLEVNPDTNKLVLSQRAAAQAASISQFEVGQLVEGKIVSIKPFGIFVDFESTSGLLHINQVSQNFVKSLPDLFQIGQPIKAVIIDRDESKGRISLSTKVLENAPGEMIDGRMADVMEQAEIRAERWRQKSA
jgi:small subunit ribosomal protein S1